MKEICSLAKTDSLAAVYTLGRLIISASGKKPTPCYHVEIKPSPLMIYPRQYVVNQCIQPGAICPEVITDYKVSEPFTCAVPPKQIKVWDAAGAHDVEVKIIDDPAQLETTGGEMPVPFGKAKPSFSAKNALMAASGKAAEAVKSELKTVRSTGYSYTFSFEEAFNDAVKHLPPDPNPYPDKVWSVHVVDIGADYGGFTGQAKLYVTVATMQ